MNLKFHTKLSYGIGGLADNAMFTLIETFLLFLPDDGGRHQAGSGRNHPGTWMHLGSLLRSDQRIFCQITSKPDLARGSLSYWWRRYRRSLSPVCSLPP